MTLTDADILSRLTNIEDATVERKTMSDSRDWVKAAVAFSNSLPVGDPGIIFIGVYNDGRIGDKGISDSTVNKVGGELSNIYPSIAPQILVRQTGGKDFIAVIVRGSPDKPHFAGHSYIRQGTNTVAASEKQFEELVAMRNSKAAQILKWKNRTITLDRLNSPQQTPMLGRLGSSQRKIVRECNEFYVTLDEANAPDNLESFPLRRTQLNFDHANKCLKLELDAL
jgi:predicted HTH transcriptional regulator